MTKTVRQWILRVFLTAVTLIVAWWIFSNSLRTAAQSSQQSSRVLEWVQAIADALFHGQIVVTSHFVRKAAHFSEYALLGFLLFLTSLSYTRRKIFFLIPAGIFLLVPYIDEGLQFFADGRAPMLADVGIDTAGGAFGFLIAWAVAETVAALLRKKRAEKPFDEKK